MPSVFEKLLLFWLVVMYLLSSLDEIYVRVELLADDLWEAEYDKTGFFSVGVDSFDRLFLKIRPISFPMVQNITKTKNMINGDKWEISTNRKIIYFLMNDWNIFFGWTPPMKKIKKPKNVKQLILMNAQDNFCWTPFYLRNTFLSQNNKSSLEQ